MLLFIQRLFGYKILSMSLKIKIYEAIIWSIL